jgi:hypothetical protein
MSSRSYKQEISKAANEGVKTGRGQGLGMGFFFFLIFCVYALGMWCVHRFFFCRCFGGVFFCRWNAITACSAARLCSPIVCRHLSIGSHLAGTVPSLCVTRISTAAT